jgi:hypothetical protein
MTKKPTPEIPIDAPTAERIAQAVARLGEAGVVERASALLAGLNAGDDFLLTVGGRHAQGILDGAPPLYWPELWGARALLHAWDDTAAQAIRAGLVNQAWRVREMCARVAAERSLPLAETVRPLLTDDVARVRAAAARAIGAVGDESDTALLSNLFRDPEIDVRRGAEQGTKQLTARFSAPE